MMYTSRSNMSLCSFTWLRARLRTFTVTAFEPALRLSASLRVPTLIQRSETCSRLCQRAVCTHALSQTEGSFAISGRAGALASEGSSSHISAKAVLLSLT